MIQFPISTGPKEDHPQRVAKLVGVDPKYYYKAEELKLYEDAINELYKLNFKANEVVSAIWIEELKFDVKASQFPAGFNWYAATPGEVILEPAEAVNSGLDRIDLIGAFAPVAPDTIGIVGKITGTPASASLVVPPDYDPTLFFPIKQVIVKAGSTTPTDENGNPMVTETVYANGTGEPNEWTFSTIATEIVNAAGVIKATNPHYPSEFFLRNAEDITGLDSNKNFSLSFEITLDAPFGTSVMIIRLEDDDYSYNTSILYVRDGLFGFDANSLVKQTIVIDGSNFSFYLNKPIRGLEIWPMKTFAGYTIDNVKFHVGSAIDPDEFVHKHNNFSILETITQPFINAWNSASTWITTNGQNILDFIANANKKPIVSAIWTSLLKFDVKASQYPAGNNWYSATSDEVILVAADELLDRIDLIGAFAPVYPDTLGLVGKITGEPASTELVVPPDYDPEIFFPIKQVIVKAGSTTPTDGGGITMTTETVYANGTGEPTEWVFSSNTSRILNSAGVVNATNPLSSSKAKFINNADVDGLDSLKKFSLSFDITLKANLGNSYIFINMFNASGQQMTSSLLLNNGDYGFNSASLVTQNIVINGTDFSFLSLGNFRQLEIFILKSFAGYTLDNIKFHVGSGVIPVPSSHTHGNLSALDRITDALINAWNNASTWVTTNGATLIAHLTRTDNPHQVTKAQVGLGDADNTSDANKPVSTAQQTALNLKLNIADYNQHFKGVYLTFAALVAANPTGEAGDYAQVNVVGAADVLNYNWDAEESVWIPNAVSGSGATNTDELPEGTTNLYHTGARVLATILSGLSIITGGDVVATDTVIQAFGKLQKNINTLWIAVNLNTAKVSFPEAPIDTKQYARKDGAWNEVVSGSSTLGIVTVPAATYQFLLTDVAKKVIFTSATAVTATIPTNATVAIPIGSKIEVTQSGAGIVTLVTTGLTVISASPLTLIIGQTVILVKTAIDTWTIDGSTTTDDMFMSTIQNVSGLKTFLAGKFGLRNVANTFTSFFTNANTAARTYTLPNKDGTVAMTSDIIAQMSGVVNYLVKFGTTTTGVVSRLWDTGTFFGIGTVNSPLKDITLGKQDNRVIGIEQSDSNTVGRDFTIEAGRTINYNDNSDFNIFSTATSNRYWSMFKGIDGSVYVCDFGVGLKKLNLMGSVFQLINTGDSYPVAGTQTPNGDIYTMKQGVNSTLRKFTASTGIWANLSWTINSNSVGMASGLNGNVYWFFGSGIYVSTDGGAAIATLLQTTAMSSGCLDNNGDILAISSGTLWKCTNSTGLFVSTGISCFGNYITVSPNNNIYCSSANGGLYMQTNGLGAFMNLNQTVRNYTGIASDSDGNIFTCVDHNGNIYKQSNTVLGASNLKGGTLKLIAGTGKGIGQSRFQIITGQKTAIGTDMQLETLRIEIDEDGNYKRIGTPIYADNASALAGGLTAGMEYRTATGIKMEVY
jgi:hypothetical protein